MYSCSPTSLGLQFLKHVGALHCRISLHPIFCQLRNCQSTFRKTWNQISKIGTPKYRNKSRFMFSRTKQKKVNTALSTLLLSKMLIKEPDSGHK